MTNSNNNEMCEWEADIVDDTLKNLFISFTEYNSEIKALKIKAVARIITQKNIRIPMMAKLTKNTPNIVIIEDLNKVIEKMINNVSKHELETLVYKIDKKYALPNVYHFCECIHK